jgi:hypothetical protein
VRSNVLQRVASRLPNRVPSVRFSIIRSAGFSSGPAIEIGPASFDTFVRQRVPWMRPEDHAHMLEGLRKSGWREE